MTTPIELAPCPFCGGEAEIARHGTPRYSTLYKCTDCSCELETGETFDHGSRWNDRPLEQQARQEQREKDARKADEEAQQGEGDCTYIEACETIAKAIREG